MTRRIDGYLSRLAQQGIDPRATVWCEYSLPAALHRIMDIKPAPSLESWTLEIPDAPTVGLGASFKDARDAVKALVRAKRAADPCASARRA